MKFPRTIAAFAAAGGLLSTGPLALAATTSASKPKGGAIKLYIQNLVKSRGKVLITGAVGDYGTINNANAAGQFDPEGVYSVAHLKHGTITFDSTGLDKGFATLKPQVNSTTCSVSYVVNGPAKVTAGTGEYAGASGSVRLSVTYGGILPKTSSGACDVSGKGHASGKFETIVGSGTVHFK